MPENTDHNNSEHGHFSRSVGRPTLSSVATSLSYKLIKHWIYYFKQLKRLMKTLVLSANLLQSTSQKLESKNVSPVTLKQILSFALI